MVTSNDAPIKNPIQIGSIEYSTTATIGVRIVPSEHPSEVIVAKNAHSFDINSLDFDKRAGFGTTIFKDAKSIIAAKRDVRADNTNGESSPKVTKKRVPIIGNAVNNKDLDAVISLEIGRESNPPEVTPTSPVRKIVRYPKPNPAKAIVVTTWEERSTPATRDNDEGDFWT